MKKLIALILSLCMLVGLVPAMAETATEAPATEAPAAEAPANTEKVDMNRLTDQLLNDIVNAVVRVDVEEAKKAGATPESSKGNVFSVYHQVLSDIAEAKEKQGKEYEDLKKLLTFDPDADEKEIEALSALVLLALIADADEKAAQQEVDPAITIANANNILKAVFEGCQANETLAAAVKDTDSKLFDILLENNKHIKEYVEKNGALDVAHVEVDEKAYAEFEAEIKKVEDHLKGIEGHKQGALDLVSLLHAVMDDIHSAIDGHAHDLNGEVDHYALVGEMLNDLVEAIQKVNLDDVKAKAGDSFDITGSVYAVYEKIVTNMMADEAVKEKESEENLKKILETIGKLNEKDMTEEEAEAVLVLLFVAGAVSEEEFAAANQIDPEADFLRASHILKATYETMMENETIKAAIEATGSRLPEMLVKSGEMLKNYLEKNKTLHKVEDVDEAPFIAFEAEYAKLRDYIAGLEDGKPGKAKALGVLNLLHEYVDDIHQAVDGHTHEEVKKQAAAFAAGAAFGMKMNDVIAALGRDDYKVDTEHTHGPVTFTELEYEHATMDGKRADEHYLFAGDELVAIRICFGHGLTSFDQVVADLSGMFGEASEPDLAVLANGIYAVDDEGKLEGRAVAIIADNMMVVVEEDKDEVEVTYVDLSAAFISAT